MNARRNVNVIADTVVMVYGATRVQDNVGTNNTTRVDDHARAYHAPVPNLDIGRNDGGRVNRRRKLLTLLPELLVQPPPSAVVSDSQNDRIVGDCVYLLQ